MAAGKFEALEFAAGNFGLLESAYEYAKDKQPPRVKMTGSTFSHDRWMATDIKGNVSYGTQQYIISVPSP